MSEGANTNNTLVAEQHDRKESTVELARLVIEAALAKKATNIAVLEMTEVSGVADYFIVCTGGSEQQVRAISDEIRAFLKEQLREIPWHKEGETHYSWVVLDYVDVVVHVMDEEKRAYYQLERLWGDANIEYVADDAENPNVKLLSLDSVADSGENSRARGES